jgi:hypothetical protein
VTMPGKYGRLLFGLFGLLACCTMNAFQQVRPQSHKKTPALHSSRATTKLFNFDDDYEQEDDEDEVTQTAYGNRSLAWTKRYRKLIPYEMARARAMELGLNSKDEWDESQQDGTCYHGVYLASRPDEMYQEEWVSWEEFLGAMRTYEETRSIVQNVLKFSNMEGYNCFVAADRKRAEGLRIPFKPEIVYKHTGWQGENEFFAKGS